jgi:hypothetical protein
VSLSQAFILPAEDDRASDRYRLLLEIRSDDQSRATPVVIHDISRTGLLLQIDEQMGADTELALDLPGIGVASAKIAWSSGNFYGAQFVVPLGPTALANLYSQSKVVWPAFQPAPGPSRRRVETSGAASQAHTTDASEGRASGSLPVAVRIQILVIVSLALWAAAIAGLKAVLA